MPVIFGCTLILIILIHYETRKHARQSSMRIDEFLQRELEANTTRKKDISGLPYLTADVSRLPDLSGCPDPEREIAAARKTLAALDGKKLLNLSDISNTDLKLTYGAANFPVLSECDAHYTAFTRGLQRLGSLLFEAGENESAALTLEYAVELKTDIRATYRLLCSIYTAQGRSDAVAALRTKAEELPEPLREEILRITDIL
ncbi:MAG: hypothetical protein K2N94_06770 [Lachnospiraceae bacterium]|nr:hypothetical protein [Lachnospiraceae bacterium]